MSLRCAACGSKRIIVESKKEGYDVVKGVVGTALIGVPGALAGAGGKKNTYYHCAACGQIFNMPMLSVESDLIDKMLENPANWKNLLKEKKAIYKNIEWEDTGVFEKPLRALTEEDRVEQMEDKILCYLNQMGTFVEEERIKTHLGLSKESYSSELTAALHSLYDSGRINEEYLECFDYALCYSIVRDLKEIETNFLKRQAEKEIGKLWEDNRDEWINLIWKKMELGKKYEEEDFKELGKTALQNRIVSDNPWLIIMIVERAIRYMEVVGMVVAGRDGVYWAHSEEERVEFLQKKKEEEIEEERRKRQAHNEAIGKILKYLEENLGRYGVSELQKNSAELSKYSNQWLRAALKYMIEDGIVEESLDKKRRVYAVVGYEEKIKEKERKEAEERRKENEKRKAVLHQEIEKLKNQMAEQEIIVAANKSKLFGEGAKAKRAAKKEIQDIKNIISQKEWEISNL